MTMACMRETRAIFSILLLTRSLQMVLRQCISLQKNFPMVRTIGETSPKPPLFFDAKEEADAIALAWALDGEEGEQGTEKTKSMPAEIARQPFVPGEFLVKFKPGKERRLNALSKILSKEKAIERHVSGISRVVLKDAGDFDEVFKKYERDTDVLSV